MDCSSQHLLTRRSLQPTGIAFARGTAQIREERRRGEEKEKREEQDCMLQPGTCRA
jgi:hypothetical protein